MQQSSDGYLKMGHIVKKAKTGKKWKPMFFALLGSKKRLYYFDTETVRTVPETERGVGWLEGASKRPGRLAHISSCCPTAGGQAQGYHRLGGVDGVPAARLVLWPVRVVSMQQ